MWTKQELVPHVSPSVRFLFFCAYVRPCACAAFTPEVSSVYLTRLSVRRLQRKAPRLDERLDIPNEFQSQRCGHHRFAWRGVDHVP